MSEGGNEEKILTLQIPIIRTESETQTLGHLVSKSPEKNPEAMDVDDQKLSIRKRRNLSKNRGQAARQREKTPEPGRTPIHEDTTTSDDEDSKPPRNSRELEADNTYEEMRRLVLEQANVKDPVYDLNTDEVMEQRAQAANERRRRSISPFALPEKPEEGYKFERKGSFIDPTNKLLSTSYIVSPKDEDTSPRRSSLTIEPPRDRRSSLTPPTPTSASPKETNSPFSLPMTPKKLEEIVYPDEVKTKPAEDKPKNLKTPVTKDSSVFTFEDKDVKPVTKDVSPKMAETKPAETKVVESKAADVKPTSVKAVGKATETQTTAMIKPITSKMPETPTSTGEIVTKVIQLERTPSRKLSQDIKPNVEIRERIVRTPSRKMSGDVKPIISKQAPAKPVREDLQSKAPPVKPARSKSATRFGSKTSESEMSEDQGNQQNIPTGAKRKILPIPRRFMKNRSPRANRSQSVARADEIKVIDKTGTEMTQTSRDILELMQKARARSLSIPKDDPRLPVEYQRYSKTLQTPQNKTPVSRTSRGISCPKTIQIISDKEILSGLTSKTLKKRGEPEKPPRRSSGYIDASQSEYTSSCYSSSPSENEYEFDLSERTAELTRKLKLLSQETQVNDSFDSIDNLVRHEEEVKSVLRKRSLADNNKNGVKKERRQSLEDKKSKKIVEEKKKSTKSRWKLIANWQQFKEDQKADYQSLISLRNRCVCDLLLIIIMFGLGGMMFRSLEGSFENAYKCGTRNVKRDFIESLWRGSHYLREEDWKSMARKKLFEFENQLHTAHEAGVTSYSGQPSWNFMNSFVYCMTIVTTIGYGHIAPKTTYGRVATIVYAIIGIPLFLIVLADFGKLFTRIIKFFWAFIRRFYYTRSCRKVRKTVPMQEMMKGLNVVYDVVRRPSQIFSEEDMEGVGQGDKPPPVGRKPSEAPPPLPPKPGQVIVKDVDTQPDTPVPSLFEIDDEFNLPISVAIFILLVYIIIGATVYNIWETWNFFESFYFVFISMSTIGLGDLVPDHPMFMMASILYLVFGLALTSMCINVVQVKLSDTFRQASAKLGATIGLKVAEEDGSLVPITPPPTEIAPVHKPKTEKEKEEIKTKENEENNTNKES
ncbi:uncharacterized protein LOC126377000 [Pectinophora gossypiella]|uniref:uncharacterized protein LOC126377000 n=1 Tax=Pectinophora gossypiella TaxID=13191 RepID=UPI00214EEAE5|nr:uncharacterized protein LOC126377000 [Pectinophora gossypiella]